MHVAAVGAAPREVGVTGEAVEDHPLRRALALQHPQHVVVRVAVVDHHRLAGVLGDRDVPPERLLLRRPPVGLGAVVVEPGLADRHDPRLRRQLVRSPPTPPRRPSGASLGWIATAAQTSSRAAARSALHRDDGTSTPIWTTRSMPTARAAAMTSSTSVVHQVEVAVAVERRRGQRLRSRRCVAITPSRPIAARGRRVTRPSAPSSSSTTRASSFANSGVGGSTGVADLAAATRLPAHVGLRSRRSGPGTPGRRRGRRPRAARAAAASTPSRPSSSCTCCEECGRNGESSVVQSLTACSATCRIVAIRSGSDSRSFHGACSERYLLASATTRIDSLRRRAHPRPLEVGTDGGERAARWWRAGRGRRRSSSPAAGQRAEVLRGERQRPVDQVAPGRDQLVVVAADELRPGEVGVVGLRPGRGQVVAQRVRRVRDEEVADVDHDVAAGGELPSLHGEELTRHDLGRQLQLAELPGRRRPSRPGRRSRAAPPARSGSGR